MDKRTLLAFIFIAIILILMPRYYELITPESAKRRPPLTPDTTYAPYTEKTPFSQPQPETTIRHAPINRGVEVIEVEEKSVTVKTNLYKATISSLGGGSFSSFSLLNYKHYLGGNVDLISKYSAGKNLILKFKSFSGDTVSLTQSFQLLGIDYSDTINVLYEPYTLTFQTYIDEKPIQKTLTFYPDKYIIDVEIDISSISKNLISQEQASLFWEGGLPPTERNVKDDVTYSAGFLFQGGELVKYNGKKKRLTSMGRTNWAAIRTKYFTASLLPKTEGNFGILHSKPDGDKKYFTMAVGFNSSSASSISLYLGPLQYDLIKEINVGLEKIMNFGWGFIRPISRGVLGLLKFMHNYIPNYGVLLIIISILVKIIVYPLTKKSYQSTKEMQAIQPLVAGLKNKYKNEPQKLNQATMKLYKEHGVNPLGGCLPMVIQMPLLFALFVVFRTTIELRGAPFIWWIKDLSVPDTIFYLPAGINLPVYGDQVAVLPILMGLSMFVQQKMMGSQAQGQQKYMMYFMTVFFFLLFNNFPSGLNLYYTLFNVLTILQQKYLVHPQTQTVVTAPAKKR